MKPFRIRYVFGLFLISILFFYFSFAAWRNEHLTNDQILENDTVQMNIVINDYTIDEDSENSLSLNYLDAVNAYKNNKFDLAINELEEEVQKSPRHAQAYFLLGKIYENVPFQGGYFYSKMASNYEKYIEIKPNGKRIDYVKLKLAQYYIKLGLTQQNAEILDKAEKYLKTLDQRNGDVRMALGAIYLDRKNFKSAISEFEHSANLHPNELRLKYNSLGLAYIKTGEYGKAEKVLNIAIQIKPDDKFAHNNLGFVYLRLNKYKSAQIQFEEALRIDPMYANAKSNLEWVSSLSDK